MVDHRGLGAVPRRLGRLMGVVALVAAACGGTSSGTRSAATPTPGPTAAPTATLAPASTPSPILNATPIPTIGQPADDGARIIAVDTPSLTGAGPNPRARDLTIDSPAVGVVQVRLLLPRDYEANAATRWPVLYLLDGSSGAHDGWTSELIDVAPLFAPTDLLVVMPDCGANDPGG